MATFDGDPIYVGDKLFDLNDGIVTVVQIYSDRILMQVGGRATRTKPFGFNGVDPRRNVRTLYWHDPRVVIPRKNAQVWQGQKALIQDYTSRFGELLTGAIYHEEQNDQPRAESRAAVRGVS